MRLQNWLKKYWVFPLAIIVFTWYIVPKWKLQNDLRKRGKCTIGIVKSEIKFTSSQYVCYIEYEVNHKTYGLTSSEPSEIGSFITIIYDSIKPNRASKIAECNEENRKNIKIRFFEGRL